MEHILIVEDEVDIATLLGFNFERAGFKVTLCHDGHDGLRTIQTSLPDLVILDVMLPSLGGYEILRELHRSQKTISIPIVMLSARAQKEDFLKGLTSGVEAYLAKPFSPKELVATVQDIIDRNQISYSETSPLPDRLELGSDTRDIKLDGISLPLHSPGINALRAVASGESLSPDDLLEAIWGTPLPVHRQALNKFVQRLNELLDKKATIVENTDTKLFSLTIAP